MKELGKKIKINSYLLDSIKSKRKEKDLTAQGLSVICNKSKFWIANIESGKTTTLSKEDALTLFSFLLNESQENTYAYLLDAINKNTFNYELYYSELLKQINHSKYTFDSIEKSFHLPKNKLITLGKSNPPTQEDYKLLKDILATLGYLNPKCIDTFLNMLGFPIPDDVEIFPIKDINNCYKIEALESPDHQFNFNNWGEYLDYRQGELDQYAENMRDENDAIEYQINQIEAENKKRGNYPSNRKKELYGLLRTTFTQIKHMIDLINVDDYEKTLGTERILETLFQLFNTADGKQILNILFKYPLHKIDPRQLKNITKALDDNLDYEYNIHIKQEKKDISCVDDLLEDYSHLECNLKPEIWGEFTDNNTDEEYIHFGKKE